MLSIKFPIFMVSLFFVHVFLDSLNISSQLMYFVLFLIIAIIDYVILTAIEKIFKRIIKGKHKD